MSPDTEAQDSLDGWVVPDPEGDSHLFASSCIICAFCFRRLQVVFCEIQIFFCLSVTLLSMLIEIQRRPNQRFVPLKRIASQRKSVRVPEIQVNREVVSGRLLEAGTRLGEG